MEISKSVDEYIKKKIKLQKLMQKNTEKLRKILNKKREGIK